MPELLAPTTALHRSYLTAMAGFAAEGRGTADDETSIGVQLRTFADRWETPEGFAEFVAQIQENADAEPDDADWLAGQTTYWWADGDRFLGSIRIRPRPVPRMMETGGHIGYDVAPAARRRGHATAMLAAVLPVARDRFGLADVVLTVLEGNAASRKVIEANRGEFETVRNGLRRYRIRL